VAHCFLFILRRPLTSTLFPYTTLFRSVRFVPARPLPDTGPAQQVDTAGGRQATAPGTHPDPAESRLPCPDQRVVSRQHARLPAGSPAERLVNNPDVLPRTGPRQDAGRTSER